MGDLPNKRYGTRSSDTPAQSVGRSSAIKQELRNEANFHLHTVESNMVDFQEASSSNCSSKDLLTDEVEVGETGLTFQDALFTIQEIKAEPTTADANEEIEDDDDMHESNLKRMKIDDLVESGTNSHVSKKVRNSVFEMRSMKGTSSVWQHFEKMQNSGKCLYCAKVIRHSKGSLSNLKRHLHAKHVGITLQRAAYCSSNGESNSKTHEEYSSAKQQSSSAIARPPVMDTFSPAMKPLPVDVQHRNQDELLLQLICQEFLPFSITESEAFKNYTYGLNPNYVIPSRKTVSEAILSREFNKSFHRVKSALENTSKVAITLDGWTNINNNTFYAITAHYIDKNNIFHSNFLQCSEFSIPHSERNMADWIAKVTEQFNITSKVVALVTDNASNLSSAAKELKVNHLPCFAHTLNLVVIKSIQNAIETIVKEVMRIVTYFRNSTTATEKLYDVQNQLNYPNLKLKQGI
ncbi:E3 SUMO-protein ligase ZBED1-like [Anopheles moucheti]|uniref:E3 SUMO-protein ligase ZBED1-like n=1 Tax=Anopheles moucheti TaxID=186751 RepID=UPI0022F06B4F|nr:E3 SUMO-protein ligase ZBED1-like [Anopheles moucheti]